ncbi:MAG: Ig-like domain-containing protein [Bacteroidales bacterium]|nr:Ig-like domain-containing protein [Bacteroidales bacterium]
MKNLYKALASAAIALLAVSCVNETGNDTTYGLLRKYNLSFEGSTKTELSGTGSTRQVKWTDGDEIQYYTKNNLSGASSASVTVNGSSAFVEIPRGRNDDFINAVYGAGSLTSSSSTFDCMYVASPAKNDQSYTTFAQAHLCAAFSSDIEDPNLRFHNAVAILKITSAAAISKVVFSGNKGEVITGGSNGSLKISYSGGAVSAAPASTGGTSVTIATGGRESDFYIAILPVSFSEGVIVRGYDASGYLLCERKTSSELNTVNAAGLPIIANLGSIQNWLDNPKPTAVDLGLSVKWASFNLGASTPEGSGDYFSWGETAPKSSYTWSTYSYGQSKNGPFSEYVADAAHGTPDYKTILDLEDDAAHAIWGDAWRMPSNEEIQELRRNCNWQWTTVNGVAGYKVTGKTTGHFIFLPAAGMMGGSKVQNAGTEGDYWSSSLYTTESCSSWSPYFTSSEFSTGDCHRYFGLPVRAVYGEVVPVEEIRLNASDLALYPGEYSQLIADILPDNAMNKSLTWLSSDDAVATVDSHGLVTAVSLGSATISVYSANGVFAECSVSVVQNNFFKSAVVRDFSGMMFAYSCDRDSLWTGWLDMSSTVLEDYLGIDWRKFGSDYQVCYQDGATTGTANSDFVGYVLDTYVLDTGKSGYELSDYQIAKTGTAFKYGTITYKPDSSGDVTGGGVNDVFYIYVDKVQKDALTVAGRTKTLYFKFVKKGTQNYYMLGFTIKLAPMETVKFVMHNPIYWYNDVEKGKFNTVRRNVTVPDYYIDASDPDYDATQTNSEVTEFVKPLTHDWVGNKVKVQGSSAELVVDWSFDTTQPLTWKNTKFKVNNNTGTDELLLTFDDPEVAGVQNDTVVVLNRTTGELRYYWNSDPDYISKKLLNLYAPKETDPAKMLYCKIKLSAKSVKRDAQGQIICEIPLGSEAIYARFLRPLTLKISDNAYLRDGVATADYFAIGTFIEDMRDWNAGDTDGLGYKIFEKDANGNFVACYKTNHAGKKLVNWYKYYGIENIFVDLSQIKTDQRNPGQEPKGLLSDVNPAATVFIAKKATPHRQEFAANEVATIPISDVAELGEWVFSYENHQGVTENFNLFVPVSVEYKWGIITREIAVPVRATQTSQGN